MELSMNVDRIAMETFIPYKGKPKCKVLTGWNSRCDTARLVSSELRTQN